MIYVSGIPARYIDDVWKHCEQYVAMGINKAQEEMKPIDRELQRNEYLGTYSSYIGSPLYHGKLQFDLWNEAVDDSLHNWSQLREEIKKYGVRNSLLIAPMPTASTSQILGNYECFEPILSNIYTRRVLSGEYMILNDYLVEDLMALGIWSTELKDKIIANDGSVQNIGEIPSVLKERYKTVWELKQRHIIDMAKDRGKYICQSQSMNLFKESPDVSTLTSMHFYGWKKGLKTGSYYIRQQAARQAQKFTVDVNIEKGTSENSEKAYQQSIDILLQSGWSEEDLADFSREDILTLARGACNAGNDDGECIPCGS